jgi:tetratricopeptide (TPR) repeat protein
MELYRMAIQKIDSFSGIFIAKLQAQAKPLIILCACIFLFGSGLFFYQLWSTMNEKAAQYDFSALMTEYETMLQDKDPEWSLLLDKIEKNIQKHARSSMLPYYTSYKVRILLHQNKKDEALVALDGLISDVVGSPIRGLYEMERALIQLDSADENIQKTGLDALQKLAQDTHNMHRDTAQFYLGRYYWSMDDVDAARAIWQQLVDEQHDEKLAPSPWISYVQDKLNITIV